MWKYNCEKRNKYYDELIRLYTQEGLGSSKISRIIPVGRTTILSWMRIPVDTRSPIPVISVQSVGDLQYRWQS